MKIKFDSIFNSPLTYLTIAVIFVGVLMHHFHARNVYIKENPISFTVIAKADPSVRKIQHKHNASLITETWIRIQYDSTNAIYDFTVENPFTADTYVIGDHYVHIDPSLHQYENAKYEYPFYISIGATLLISVLILISVVFMFFAIPEWEN